MDFNLLPFDKLLSELENQKDPDKAFSNIVGFGNDALPSKIWETFKDVKLEKDIQEATNWIQSTIDEFPEAKGIYLGLDTLNMDNGKGTNVEIGLSDDCDPHVFSDEWTYECENYGDSHLIGSLYSVSDSFSNEKKWSNDETSFAEYLIFLGYSGVVLREALLKVKIKNDFISIWGFHDGDMFYLVNKIGEKRNIITGTEI